MSIVRTTVVGCGVLAASVWVLSPWLAKMEIVKAATELNEDALARRIDFPAYGTRQTQMVALTERARADAHPTLAFAVSRPVSRESLSLIRSNMPRDPDFRRFVRGEGNVTVSNGFWRGLNSFSFQVSGDTPNPTPVLKVYMSFRWSQMAWKVVGMDIFPAQ